MPKMNVLTHLLIFLLFLASCACADRFLLLEQKILSDIFKGYDRRVRPYGENGTGPVIVEVNTYLRSLNDFNDLKMTIATQLTFRQEWLDERLQYDSQGMDYVTLTSPDRLWLPDIFFKSEMKAHFHNILTPNNLIRIYPDGHVLYSTRISLELFCPMDLHNYPMDYQVCEIPAASYGYTTKDIIFRWKKKFPLQISSEIFLPKFSVPKIMTDYCTSKTTTGEYSCILMILHFQRQFAFYLLQAYMPSAALVVLSWLAFWLHPRSVTIRLGIWIAVLLSLFIVNTSVGNRGPRVSYIKAIDVWMGTCVTFVFCVLLELAIVNNALTNEDRGGRRTAEESDKTMGVEDGGQNHSSRPPHYSATPFRWLNRYHTRAQRIDAVSRLLFPVAFGLFNFIYWLTYTASYHYPD